MFLQPVLSFCIPTYNRARYIGETIAAIRSQAGGRVEIVVSDNASEDDTEDVVRRAADGDPLVTCVRQPQNRGADANYLEVVRLARGEFCWLMGSDDYPAPGAIAEVERLLGPEVDVLLMDRMRMSMDMRNPVAVDRFLGAPDGETFDCSRPGELERYFASANFIGSLFSYISSIVVRRAAWNAQPDRPEFIGSAYVHAARIFDILKSGGRLRYAGQPLILNRQGNDSFEATLGYGRRRKIDFNYVPIARAVFADRPAARELVIRRIELDFFRLVQMLPDKRSAFRADGEAGVQSLRDAYIVLAGRRGFRTRMVVFDAFPQPALEALWRLATAARRLAPWRRWSACRRGRSAGAACG